MDSVYFIENYCRINGKPIKLKDYQKAILHWFETIDCNGYLHNIDYIETKNKINRRQYEA